jgi:hypothetical protein
MRHISLAIKFIMGASAWMCLSLASCGTGIEVTEHVTDKDVQRVLDKNPGHQPVVVLEAYQDSLMAWKAGKRFWVTDDQVNQMLMRADGYDKDTLRLAGHILEYRRCVTSGLSLEGDSSKVDILFHDQATGLPVIYRYGKSVEESHAGFSLPMLIDLDMVRHVAGQLVGNEYFIRTPIWYDRQSEQMMDGRHFIKVRIDSVLPGNTVLPLRVLFTTADSNEQAMVWMNNNVSTMHGRDFDALFTPIDPRLAHPTISDDNWQRITRGIVVEGMIKEECRLALGSPKRINERPDQAGMREYWYYDGGAYLFFVDGLLNQFRK